MGEKKGSKAGQKSMGFLLTFSGQRGLMGLNGWEISWNKEIGKLGRFVRV